MIEIPAGTLEKWEYNKSTRDIELELINIKPRIFSYLGYPANYGMIPKTLLPKKYGGDGDPLDVIVIGPAEPRGSIVKCKIIGVLYLIDNFEQDDKLIAISSKSGWEILIILLILIIIITEFPKYKKYGLQITRKAVK